MPASKPTEVRPTQVDTVPLSGEQYFANLVGLLLDKMESGEVPNPADLSGSGFTAGVLHNLGRTPKLTSTIPNQNIPPSIPGWNEIAAQPFFKQPLEALADTVADIVQRFPGATRAVNSVYSAPPLSTRPGVRGDYGPVTGDIGLYTLPVDEQQYGRVLQHEFGHGLDFGASQLFGGAPGDAISHSMLGTQPLGIVEKFAPWYKPPVWKDKLPLSASTLDDIRSSIQESPFLYGGKPIRNVHPQEQFAVMFENFEQAPEVWKVLMSMLEDMLRK